MFVTAAFIYPVVSLVAQSQAAPTAVLPTAPTIAQQTLPSGLHLIVVERPEAKLTAIEIRVRGAGSGIESPEENGTAHVIEHLVFKGTADKKQGAFDAAFERMGGEASAQTTRDGTAFRTTVFPDKTKEALDLFAELLMKPAFRADDWKQERIVIESEMRVAQADTQRAGLQSLSRIAYPEGDAYHLPIMGSVANLERFTPDDFQKFHDLWYRPTNFTVVVVGPVKTSEIRAAVEAGFPPPVLAPPAPNNGGARGDAATTSGTANSGSPIIGGGGGQNEGEIDSIIRAPLPEDKDQTTRQLATLFLGFRAPRLSIDPAGAAASDVLAAYLLRGGSGGVLGRRLLNGGPPNTLSLAVDYLPQTRRSLFTISATGEQRDIGRIEDALVAELSGLAEKILMADATDETLTDELEAAKAAVLGDERYRRQTVEGEAQYLAYLDVLNAPADYREKYAERVRAVTMSDLSRLLERYVTPTKRAVAVIGLTSGSRTDESGSANDRRTDEEAVR